ncbi:HK97 gp10 family phage protein [Bifidobacterium crudilactis]|uniref:HK97 gp10 family phage protein n=1 Tax=Bifidobacterium crudilactis TaxID=327277 RepID=UPI002354FD9F|nr:HK97 gp10 family phage protein [Bifidobacterium crudilactis]MCI2158288.1 HK97 gp10 family phage protein [Bifidobacterium crudilactis]
MAGTTITASGAKTTITVKGADNLARTLKKAGADMKDLRKGNKQAAQVVVGPARTLAPKGKTGRLSKSVRAGATAKAGVIRAGNNKTVPYAGPIEYGWPGHHIEAQPFVRTAAKQTEPQWTQIYKKIVDDAIAQVYGITSK